AGTTVALADYASAGDSLLTALTADPASDADRLAAMTASSVPESEAGAVSARWRATCSAVAPPSFSSTAALACSAARWYGPRSASTTVRTIGWAKVGRGPGERIDALTSMSAAITASFAPTSASTTQSANWAP